VDCYQRAEGRYRLMPGIITNLAGSGTPFSILTKGTLLLRDLPMLRSASRDVEVSLAMSVGFLDPGLWRAIEPGTPDPARRLDAVRALADSGLGCSVLMAPVLPFLTDSPEQLRATVEAIARAGAKSITPIVLHLRPGAREWFMGWLAANRPDLVPRYRGLYRDGSYAPTWYTRRITDSVRELAAACGLAPPLRDPARDRQAAMRAGRTPAAPLELVDLQPPLWGEADQDAG
jgi:DNA repair photolyase